jgi:hypothetical protein
MRFRMLVKAHQAGLRNLLALTIVFAVLAATARLTAQQPPEVKPGPEHALLKESEGTWDATIKTMEGESKGTETCKMALNGLWLLDHFKADLGGMPFEGRGATSYDPAKKKYVGVWIDSMATSPMISEGTYDKATRTMTMVGDMPAADGKSTKATMTTVYKDANTKIFTLRSPGPDGKDFEMLHITYKRRAK